MQAPPSGDALQSLGEALRGALARVRGADDLYDLTCGVLRHHLGPDVRLSLYEQRSGRMWLRAQRGYAATINSYPLADDALSQAVRSGLAVATPEGLGVDPEPCLIAPFATPARRGALVLMGSDALGDPIREAADDAMRVVEQTLGSLPAAAPAGPADARWLSRAFLRLANTRDRDALSELAARLVGELLGVDVVQTVEGFDELEVVATWRASEGDDCVLAVDEVASAVAGANGEHFQLRLARPAGACDVVGLPLRAGSDVLGYLIASSRQPHELTVESLEGAELLADHAATALTTLGMLERSERAAVTDGLTGLWNHRRFYETALALIEAPKVEFALVLADIDDFKELNDRRGHVAGDDALRAVAGVLRRGMRPGDSVFRIGGEEFALLLPATSRPNARTVCRRLQRTLEQLDLGDWRLTLSFGVARSPEDGSDLRVLMQAADAALYEAKRLGKDRITMASERLVARRSPTMKARTRRGFEQMRQLEALVVRLGVARTPHAVARELLDGLREVVPGAFSIVWALEDGRFSGGVLAGSVDDAEVERSLCELGLAALSEGRTSLRDDDPELIPSSAIVAPLGTPPLAVVGLAAIEGAPFDRDDLRLVEVATRVAGLALSNALRVVPVGAPSSLALAIARCESLEEMGRTICEHVAARVRADRCSVWQRLDANRSELVYVIGADEAIVRRHRLTGSLAWREPGVPHTILIDGAPPEHPLEELAYTPESRLAVVPIALDDSPLGSICVTRVVGVPFRPDEVAVLEDIGAQAALALHAFRSTELAEAELLSTIESLVSALEVQDPATSRHALAIVELAVGVGRRLGLAAADLRRLEHGAALHDMGKIGVASELLRKPGPLDAAETLAMRAHPELGARILEPVTRLRDLAPIVRASHERYDGLGYPDGIVGEAIPLEARIVSVCDAFDAMVSDRPYRRALTRESALAELRAGAGSQFDPQVVHAFIEELAYMHREAS